MMSEGLSLKDFIQGTLVDVCEAIEEARDKFSYIAPQIDNNPQNTKATLVEFDVAITVGEVSDLSSQVDGKLKGKVGISVLKAEANVDGNISTTSESSTSIISRVKFNVPVHFRFDPEANRQRIDSVKKQNRVIDEHNKQNKSSGRI